MYCSTLLPLLEEQREGGGVQNRGETQKKGLNSREPSGSGRHLTIEREGNHRHSGVKKRRDDL